MLWPHDEPWARWTSALLTVPVQFWVGWPFLRPPRSGPAPAAANMDTLVAIGTLAAFGFSPRRLLRAAGPTTYFDMPP